MGFGVQMLPWGGGRRGEEDICEEGSRQREVSY